MKINTRLSLEQRDTVAERLHLLLADEYVLSTKTRKAHWNVTGPHFMSYHKLFEEQYEQLAETVDAVAERSLMLGIKVPATLAELSQLTRLNEEPGENPDADGLISVLLTDHEAIVRQLREDIESTAELGDDGTTDFFTGLLEQHEKTAWMLRSHLTE
ncbi:Dps family protein [Armatimonas rosea]|uniref:Starvation-inducible DNA-binding protein n=1 Tax=Armatimonas rosea TaxID=685828 RepID=A0A7W9STY4_ARMRO|nr:DNA starvation/stationary phase protection protein [Armatimonas rosea]MBB6052283.1 starvation-inducible DNA-binding protein [Armatimonas rosea]